MFASDRDLLVLEPGLFGEVRWPGQTLYESTKGVVPSTMDLLIVSDPVFEALGVGAGSVAILNGVPVEVIERVSASVLRVSMLRASVNDAAIPFSSEGFGLGVVVSTFAPQIESAHRGLMDSLGIAEPAAGVSGVVDDDAVTNPSRFVLAESLGALALVYASASALVGDDSVTWAKAMMYRERFRAERGRLFAEVDRDGDGAADSTRRLGTGRLVRG